MDIAGLLDELYGRIPPLARDAVDGLDADTLVAAPGPGTNTIAWLVWHSARVQDHHVERAARRRAGLAGRRLGRALRARARSAEHRATATPPTTSRACDPTIPTCSSSTSTPSRRARVEWLRGLAADDLDRIVDRRWDPPVTLGVRLVSVADDSLQHLGQAAYVRGLLDR